MPSKLRVEMHLAIDENSSAVQRCLPLLFINIYILVYNSAFHVRHCLLCLRQLFAPSGSAASRSAGRTGRSSRGKDLNKFESTTTECGEKARASYQRNLIPREDDADEQLGSWQLQPGNEGGFEEEEG